MKIRKMVAAGAKAAFALAVLHWCGRLAILRVSGFGALVPMGTRLGLATRPREMVLRTCLSVLTTGPTPVVARVVYRDEPGYWS